MKKERRRVFGKAQVKKRSGKLSSVRHKGEVLRPSCCQHAEPRNWLGEVDNLRESKLVYFGDPENRFGKKLS